jgi:ATP-binding cassette subfamily B protein
VPTTLVIAHRLSTLLNMDRILVFGNGKIIEDGSHESLIKHKGIYFALWTEQVNGISSKMKFNTIDPTYC